MPPSHAELGRRSMLSNRTMETVELFKLRGEHITLDALLKATGLATSGGGAKVLIADGVVRVNGEVELRRGRKLRVADEVVVEVAAGARRVRLLAAATHMPLNSPV